MWVAMRWWKKMVSFFLRTADEHKWIHQQRNHFVLFRMLWCVTSSAHIEINFWLFSTKFFKFCGNKGPYNTQWSKKTLLDRDTSTCTMCVVALRCEYNFDSHTQKHSNKHARRMNTRRSFDFAVCIQQKKKERKFVMQTNGSQTDDMRVRGFRILNYKLLAVQVNRYVAWSCCWAVKMNTRGFAQVHCKRFRQRSLDFRILWRENYARERVSTTQSTGEHVYVMNSDFQCVFFINLSREMWMWTEVPRLIFFFFFLFGILVYE